MANTYSQIYIQMVFAVKGRQNFILEPIRERLQQYISGIITQNKQKTLAIYSMPDHTHILTSMQPDINTSDLVRDIKSGSTTFLKNEKLVNDSFTWQSGFGAFSYSKSQSKNVINYILNQEKHHQKKTFRQEYLQFLKLFEIEYDEKYLFEFYD